MTVPTQFDNQRSSGNMVFTGVPDDVGSPTQRGKRIVAMTSGSTFVAFPTGTLEGDKCIFFGSSGWNFNGGASSIAGIYTELIYTNGTGTPISGWISYFTVTAAMITAGGFTIASEGGTTNGLIWCSTYAPDTNFALMGWVKTSVAGNASVSLGGTGENDLFLLFGACEDGGSTVDFPTYGEDDTFSQATYSASMTDFVGSARQATELVNYSVNTRGSFSACVRVTKAPSATSGVPIGPSPGGLTVCSNGANTASVSKRQATGLIYWEAKVDVLVGTVGIGIAAGDFNYNSILGVDRQGVAYRQTGVVVVGNATIATLSNYAQGDIVCVAYNSGTKTIWFRVNNGSWNNDGTANPATGVGGIDLNVNYVLDIATDYWPNGTYPSFAFSIAGSVITATFDEEEWVYSAPSGYISIEQDTFSLTAYTTDPMSYMIFGEEPDDAGDWNCNATELPENNHTAAIAFPAGPVKTLAGEVQEDSVGVEGRLVRVYNRRTGELVGEARTNATGDFVIPAIDPTLPHFIVAFDDDVAPDYNAKIYDNVIPQ